MDVLKLRHVLEWKCIKIAQRVLKDDQMDNIDFDDEDCIDGTPRPRSRTRAAWRQYLTRLGVTWKYSSWGMVYSAPEGHVAVRDVMVDKGATTLFIPAPIAEKALVLGFMPDPERKPACERKKPEGPIVRASKNKTQYIGLKTVTSNEDGRRIIFVFNNGESVFYNVANSKWFHSNTEKEMGDSHFNNISWGEPLFIPPPARPGSRWNEFKPGCDGFYEQIAQVATEGWVKTYFTMLGRWTKHYAQCHRRADREVSKRAVQQANRLDVLTGENSMAIESLAKNQYIQKMPMEIVYKIAFDGDKILDFKAFKDRGMDAWFCKHLGERATTEYVISDHEQGQIDHRIVDLGAWLEPYHNACRMGHGDLWRYTWEKYKFAIGYGYRFCGDRFGELVKRGYNPKKIIDYVLFNLPMQGICTTMTYQNWDGITLLADYAKMQSDMCERYERYPKSLKMSHDIASKNHRVKESKVFAEMFSAKCEGFKKFEFSDKEYSVISPKDVNDFIREGVLLNHCVGSYVSRVVDNKSVVMFMRKTEELDAPVVTIEIETDGSRIMQARGNFNRDLDDAETKFVAKYADHINPEKQKKIFEAA